MVFQISIALMMRKSSILHLRSRKNLMSLVKMGYTESEASITIEWCGIGSSLVDWLISYWMLSFQRHKMRIRKDLEDYDADETPPKTVQLYALYEWPQVKSCAVGKNRLPHLNLMEYKCFWGTLETLSHANYHPLILLTSNVIPVLQRILLTEPNMYKT